MCVCVFVYVSVCGLGVLKMTVPRFAMSPLLLVFVAMCWVSAQAIMVPSGKVGPIVPPTPRPRRTVPSSTYAPAPVYEEAEDPSINEVDGGPRYNPPVYRPPLLKHLLLRSHSLKFRQLYAHQLPEYFQKEIVGQQSQVLPKYDRGTTRVKHSDQVVPLAYYRRKMYYSGYPDYDY